MSKSMDNLLYEFAVKMVKELYPNLEHSQQKQLLRLYREKGISLVDTKSIETVLDSLLCSIIRHNHTTYENLLRHVERYKARAIVQPIVKSTLNSVKAKSDIIHRGVSAAVPVLDPKLPTRDKRPRLRNITKSERNNPSFNDFTGMTHGGFTVLGLSAESRGRWVVQCLCGAYDLLNAKTLRNGTARQHCFYCERILQGVA